MYNKSLLSILIGLFLVAFALKKRTPEPTSYIPTPFYRLPVFPTKNDTVALGRLLFYDNILSANNQVSCASCHNSYNAFAHTDHQLSHGIFDSVGTRNAPGLFNLAWQKEFMWDGATHHIEAQALAPLHDPKEMGSNIKALLSKLRASDFYRKAFYDTYKDTIINSNRTLKALAAFELSLVSFESKYDAVKTDNAEFSTQEKAGYKLFKQNCNKCHTEPLFTNGKYMDNNLPIDSSLDDKGRFLVTKQKEDRYKFKVPSLRNLSYTYPYMHDGRFTTLNQVLQHYSSNQNIKNKGKADLEKAIHLSFNERADLISFLLTLNDKNFVFNPAYSFPKKLKDYLIQE
ncbi:MAG: cytochrome c peroxidase [Crocinitomicaceae bacterium]|nr:cytochrome c peroxidase [Crocinitomicaceae bacterium]MDG1734448.1 cytochrome c peroxidase [Crocinitomicaceae bacterium]